MAQIGYGYGSEYQLLRFLGHHRNELELALHKAGVPDGDFYWFDFDYADRDRILSGDSEICGLSFLEGRFDNYSEVKKEIKSYSWTFNSWQYWDAVFIVNNVVYFVEAKAHKDELKSGSKTHGGTNSDAIFAFMSKQFSCATDEWLKDYYQFANRISTVAMINKKGIQCKLVNIYFIDGYYDRERGINKDTSREEFEEEIEKELEALGLSKEEKDKYVIDLFIDANPHP